MQNLYTGNEHGQKSNGIKFKYSSVNFQEIPLQNLGHMNLKTLSSHQSILIKISELCMSERLVRFEKQ